MNLLTVLMLCKKEETDMPHFIEGDFRFLSGAGGNTERISRFHGSSSCLHDNEVRLTDAYVRRNRKRLSVPAFLRSKGQKIFNTDGNIYPYHGAPSPNRVIQNIQEFLLGFELEAIAKSPASYDLFTTLRGLASNWFTLQCDSSLPTYGVEIVSCPLNVTQIRDIKFWQQVCQGLSTYVTSRLSSACGLHFHINVEYFMNPQSERDRPDQHATAALLLAFAYNRVRGFLSNGFLTELFGRATNNYCSTTAINNKAQDQLAVLSKLKESLPIKYYNKVKAIPAVNPLINIVKTCNYNLLENCLYNFTGHHSEVNLTGNPATFEFRRGKGAIDPASIHAQVEFIYLMSAYIKNNPEYDIVENNTWGLLQYIIRHTKSALLLYYINKHCPEEYEPKIPLNKRIKAYPMTGMTVSTKLKLGGKHAKQPTAVVGNADTSFGDGSSSRDDAHNNAE